MFLHSSTIYGPLSTRRLGNSLGINLLPVKRKVCNFECIYCECGWTDTTVKDRTPTLEEFSAEFEKKLRELSLKGEPIDHITFAGNGEPTLHPKFEEIIETTIGLRNKFYPEARIAVLSNATRIHHPKVFYALKQIDDRIMKLDAGTEAMFQLIDMPEKGITLDGITEDLKKFNGDVIIQTLFMRGVFSGRVVDNTTESELQSWVDRLHAIQPKRVLIYSIDRETPADGLNKVSKTELQNIAEFLRLNKIPAEYYA